MTQEHMEILEMVEKGEITVSEAVKLIQAMEEPSAPANDWTMRSGEVITIEVNLNGAR